MSLSVYNRAPLSRLISATGGIAMFYDLVKTTRRSSLVAKLNRIGDRDYLASSPILLDESEKGGEEGTTTDGMHLFRSS